jgi:hypothetical protein
LYLTLLINTQHQRLRWRVHVQANDIVNLDYKMGAGQPDKTMSMMTLFTEEQIIPALQEVEVSLPVKELGAPEVFEARRICTFRHLLSPTP